MRLSAATLMTNVYEILGDDEFNRHHWTRRQVGWALQAAIDRLRTMGVRFTFWNSAAVSLSAGTAEYTYTHSPTVGTAALKDIEVHAARLNSDGTYLDRRSLDALSQMRAGNTSGRGTPTDFAVFRYVTAAVSSGDSESIRILVYPTPGADNLPESLDLLVSGGEGITILGQADGFGDTTQNDIDLPDAVVIALQFGAAAELVRQATPERLAELNLAPASADVFERRFMERVNDHVQRIYLDGATDIQLMER